MSTSIKLTNVQVASTADPLIEALEGTTYMDLHVSVCPVGGSFDVLVGTLRKNVSEAKLTDMVLMVMAGVMMGIK